VNYFQQNLLFIFWQAEPIPAAGWMDIVWLLIQTVIALAIVCGLAIVIFRYILPRLNAVSFNKSIVRIVDGASIDARKRLMVIEVAGKYLLIAVSETGVQLVSELEGDSVESAITKMAEAQKEAQPPFKQVTDSFAQIMERVRRK
jgi:flagellar biogenesis protein FliO